jgi:hypothetical protein
MRAALQETAFPSSVDWFIDICQVDAGPNIDDVQNVLTSAQTSSKNLALIGSALLVLPSGL